MAGATDFRGSAVLEGLERAVAASEKIDKPAVPAGKIADNPAYLNLIAQKQSNSLEIASLNKRRVELHSKLQEYEKRLQNLPDIERQYFSLLRDWENTNTRYRELKEKQMEAQIAEQLERKSKGERFSVVEPPLLPEKPIKPNRPLLAALGFVLALAAAVGFVVLRASLDKSIRKPTQITEITGVPPLAVIPYLALDEEVRTNSRRVLIILAGLAAVLLAALLLAHWLWMPLDVLWFRGLRKLDQVLG